MVLTLTGCSGVEDISERNLEKLTKQRIILQAVDYLSEEAVNVFKSYLDSKVPDKTKALPEPIQAEERWTDKPNEILVSALGETVKEYSKKLPKKKLINTEAVPVDKGNSVETK